jgi:hypothetical protein
VAAHRKKTSRRHALGAADGQRNGAWGRSFHEEEAARAIRDAGQKLVAAFACSPTAVRATVKANRIIAQARTHLVSIGPKDSSRTRKLWGAVGRVEKRVEAANDRLARCLG